MLKLIWLVGFKIDKLLEKAKTMMIFSSDTFFKTVFLVMVIGLIHALVFLPVMLALLIEPLLSLVRPKVVEKLPGVTVINPQTVWVSSPQDKRCWRLFQSSFTKVNDRISLGLPSGLHRLCHQVRPLTLLPTTTSSSYKWAPTTLLLCHSPKKRKSRKREVEFKTVSVTDYLTNFVSKYEFSLPCDSFPSALSCYVSLFVLY